MTDDEVEVVAAELAKAGGVSWYPGRERGPLKLVADRYRDRARLAIAALDRHRAGRRDAPSADGFQGSPQGLEPGAGVPSAPGDAPTVGSTVLYRPPGDRRAYPCRIEKMDGSRVYLMPEIKTCTGWVDADELSHQARGGAPEA